MGIRICAATWLVLQLVQIAAGAVDPERCTEIEVATPEIDQALLQAGVGRHRVTLPDAVSDRSAGAEQQNATVDNAGGANSTVERVNLELLSKENETVAAINTSVDQQKGKPQQNLSLVAVGSNVSQEQETESFSLQRLASASVLSIMHHGVRYIHEELPASLVYAIPSLKTDIGAVFGLSLASFMIWCTLVVLTACLYRSHKSFPQAVSSRPEQDFNDWTSGPFEIHSDWKVCCWSCCCPCIRWADNMDMLGIMSFWVGLLIFCVLVLLGTVPGGLLFWLVASLLWMSFRQQFRSKFDMEQNNLRSFLGDCMLYCCCWPCAIAQEARHIEEACRAAHKAVRKCDVV